MSFSARGLESFPFSSLSESFVGGTGSADPIACQKDTAIEKARLKEEEEEEKNLNCVCGADLQLVETSRSAGVVGRCHLTFLIRRSEGGSFE